jgi:GPH family glycoside/pentoside/hexuronide:cation symporter
MLASMPNAKVSLPLVLVAGWGIGSLPMSLMFNATSLFVLKYLIDYVGLAAAVAGPMIAAAKLFDAVLDPLIGSISDRTRSRWGRRRPYMLIGGLLSAISFAALFNLANNVEAGQIWGMSPTLVTLLVLLVNAAGYGLFCVPYLAMPAEMTPDYHERTRLMAYRVGSIALGQLAASWLGSLWIAAWGGGALGHSRASLLLALIIVAGAWLSFALTRDAPAGLGASAVPSAGPGQHGLRAAVHASLENRPFLVLLALKVIYLLGLAVFLSILPFLITRALGLSYGAIGTFFLGQASLMLLSQPLWLRVSKALGKRAAYVVATVVYCAVLLTWLLADTSTGNSGILLRGIGSGVASGGLLLISQSLLPDTMEYDFRRTGARREGLFSGVYTTIEKFSFALGPAITGPLLASAGYIASSAADVVEPPSAIRMIYICTVAIPVVATLISAALLWFYPLNEQKLRELTKS